MRRKYDGFRDAERKFKLKNISFLAKWETNISLNRLGKNIEKNKNMYWQKKDQSIGYVPNSDASFLKTTTATMTSTPTTTATISLPSFSSAFSSKFEDSAEDYPSSLSSASSIVDVCIENYSNNNNNNDNNDSSGSSGNHSSNHNNNSHSKNDGDFVVTIIDQIIKKYNNKSIKLNKERIN